MDHQHSRSFQSIEEDYFESKRNVNNCINDLAREDADQGLQYDASSKGQMNLIEAQRNLKLMTTEARTQPLEMRKTIQSKINVYRDEIKAMQRDFDRAKLMHRTSESSQKTANSGQYRQIQMNTDRLQKSSETLQESRRMVAETEAIGISVLDSLAEQRESLLSSRNKIDETKSMTGEAHRILKRMARQMITNRIVLWFTIVFLCLCVSFVFYHNFIRSHRT